MMTEVPNRALANPVGYVRKLLTDDRDTSSLTIERDTDVPASTIRSIRQGVTNNISFDTWLAMLTYYGEIE